MNLTKQQATAIFGSGDALARALGVTKSAVSQWPDELDKKRTAMVIGAAVQAGKSVPPGFVPPAEQAVA
ncbi:Cro/CI family transcriptional regulator [Paraburkholderia sp. SIMBA_027]|uniref:Cro/CI family transcriptional regulator n=1 Tax=Paraburkholderia sp. SIMBA_027 TaxID=3085770 RepID=UPI00397A7083